MQVIIPCAGRSSRFPWTRPKFLLTMPDGRLMFEWAADRYIGHYPITFVITEQHAKEFDAEIAIRHAYSNRSDVSIVILSDFTSGPAETIYKTIAANEDTSIIVQDCDSFFNYRITDKENFVCYIDLEEYPNLDHIASKGFIVINDKEDSLRNIVEKRVVSNNVCVGAYGFRSSKEFCDSYEELKDDKNEIFISHIVKHLLIHNNTFITNKATDYLDLGTYESYIKVKNDRSTYFTDLDGVIFYNQSMHFSNNYETAPKPIVSAVNYMLKKQSKGATFIFTTSRPQSVSKITEEALIELGFKNFKVLYDLPHSPRVLVNDVSNTNPFPSATAINSPRDSDDFWKSIT